MLQKLKLVWLRRTSQVIFLLAFFDLLLRTEFRGSVRLVGEATKVPFPLQLFFALDPLVALTNLISTHALYRGLWMSLLVLVPTLLFGRFFCGWVCPMGTLNHLFSSFPSESKRGKRGIESNRYKRWQTLKYYILIGVLVTSITGSGLVGWFDPFSLLVRSLGLSGLPAFDYASKALLHGMESSQNPILQVIAESLHGFMESTVLSYTAPHYRQGFILAVILTVLLASNLFITRLWCRLLCPLGALLGVASRWSLLGLKKDTEACNQCKRCLVHCQGGDDPLPGAQWRKAECHLCLNCVSSCPHQSLKYGFVGLESVGVKGPDLRRRQALVGVAGGLAIVPLLRSPSGFDVEINQWLIRPPGAAEEKEFLNRCIRCGECMKICPTNTLQPAWSEAGVEGLWTPVLAPRIGFCEPKCVLCSRVCPTGAIAEISLQDKAWNIETTGKNNRIRLGTAFIDRSRCLPWSAAEECGICEKACPESIHAVSMVQVDTVDSKGVAKTIKQPHIDPSLCVGCGACEYACPLREHPAVYVTSIGESRSPNNHIVVNARDISAGE
jgi:polyferredoxin